jgi:hypothetical protein
MRTFSQEGKKALLNIRNKDVLSHILRWIRSCIERQGVYEKELHVQYVECD